MLTHSQDSVKNTLSSGEPALMSSDFITFPNTGLFPAYPTGPLSSAHVEQACDWLLFCNPTGPHSCPGQQRRLTLASFSREHSAQHMGGTCSNGLLLHNKPPETQDVRQQCFTFSLSCAELWAQVGGSLFGVPPGLGSPCDCSRWWLELEP